MIKELSDKGVVIYSTGQIKNMRIICILVCPYHLHKSTPAIAICNYYWLLTPQDLFSQLVNSGFPGVLDCQTKNKEKYGRVVVWPSG